MGRERQRGIYIYREREREAPKKDTNCDLSWFVTAFCFGSDLLVVVQMILGPSARQKTLQMPEEDITRDEFGKPNLGSSEVWPWFGHLKNRWKTTGRSILGSVSLNQWSSTAEYHIVWKHQVLSVIGAFSNTWGSEHNHGLYQADGIWSSHHQFM